MYIHICMYVYRPTDSPPVNSLPKATFKLQEPAETEPATSAPSRRLRLSSIPASVEIQTCPAGGAAGHLEGRRPPIVGALVLDNVVGSGSQHVYMYVYIQVFDFFSTY